MFLGVFHHRIAEPLRRSGTTTRLFDYGPPKNQKLFKEVAECNEKKLARGAKLQFIYWGCRCTEFQDNGAVQPLDLLWSSKRTKSCSRKLQNVINHLLIVEKTIFTMEINVGVKSFKSQNQQLSQNMSIVEIPNSICFLIFKTILYYFCSFSFFNSLLHDSVKDYICISILYYKDVVQEIQV